MKYLIGVTLALAAVCVAAPPRGDAAATRPAAPTVVIDTTGFRRIHYTFRKPVFRAPGGLETSPVGYETEPPAAGWTRPGFDDSEWRRAAGAPLPPIRSSWAVTFRSDAGFIYVDGSSPSLALICTRQKFRVTDPAAVGPLHLAIEYRGGVVVYLNGKELTRAHLPKTGGPEAPADGYPVEAFVGPAGKLLEANRGEKDKAKLRRWGLRTRKLAALHVPAEMLRRGLNVLAVEVHRAPYPKQVIEKLRKRRDSRFWGQWNWSTCGLTRLRLTAAGPAGIVPNVARPTGLQVWNSNPMAPDFDMDWGDPDEPLKPIRLVAARNGSFSGKVVVGSDQPLEGLRAEMSALARAGGGELAASTVQVRYAALLGATGETGAESHYRASPGRFDALLDAPPAEVPVRAKAVGRASRNLARPGQPAPVFGAVQPVWITANVPADARPGAYTGALTIRVTGEEPIRVPVRVEVADFSLPSPADFETVVDLVHSPESVALKYKTPLYCDEHFRHVAASQKLLGLVGNRTMYVHLICRLNLGNAESHVRWVREDGGNAVPDFTVLDRYIDTVVANMGKPKIVCLQLYDYHLPRRKAMPVTALDPATGKTETIELPLLHEPGAVDTWRPVADHIRRRLAAHGIDGAIQMLSGGDSPPAKPIADAMMELFPKAKWMRHAHSGRRNIHGYPLGYQALVWSPRWQFDPKGPSLHGWSNPKLTVQFMRSGEATPITIPRLLGEMNIFGRQRGFGRIGADFWSVLPRKDRRSRRGTDLVGRYPESTWRNLEWMTKFIFAAGPDGPVSTRRFEMMREGVQECEAVIALERALLARKIGGPLADRCRAILAERRYALLTGLDNHGSSGLKLMDGGWWSNPSVIGSQWYVSSGWQGRSSKLFAAAGEVARATSRK